LEEKVEEGTSKTTSQQLTLRGKQNISTIRPLISFLLGVGDVEVLLHRSYCCTSQGCCASLWPYILHISMHKKNRGSVERVQS
jgi:hypothetical protein